MMMMMAIKLTEHTQTCVANKSQKLTADVGGRWSNCDVVEDPQCGHKTLRHVGDLVTVLTYLRHELGHRHSIGHKRWTDSFQRHQPVVELGHMLVHLAHCYL